MRLASFFPDWETEFVGNFDDEDNPEMAHIVCDHDNGICLDDIVEPAEIISYVIEFDGIVVGDNDAEMALISFWNSGY